MTVLVRVSALLVAAWCVTPSVAPLQAQHRYNPTGSFDPSVPTPRQVLGYEVGDRFTPHHVVHRYFEQLARASDRARLDTLGYTTEGREVLLLTVTSSANAAKLDDIKRQAEAAAYPDRTPDAALRAMTARMPSVVWLGYTVHGNEASGTEAALATAYQLVAGTDAETRMLLDSLVVLIDPIQNPDGHERHAQDVMRARSVFGVPSTPGTLAHQGSWPGPRTSHYYFDLNRDWFIHSHPETRARITAFYQWWPHVAVDLHEMGSNSTYFFAPPMAPVNKHVAPQVLAWWDIYAAGNAAAFDRFGWPYFRREGYDEFYPGYGVSWPILNGAVGMTYEQASSGAGAIRRRDGTVLTLRDAAHHHYTTSIATLRVTAERRAARVQDYIATRRLPLTTPGRGVLRTVAITRDAQGRADSLIARLLSNRVQVQRTDRELTLSGTRYGRSGSALVRVPAGSYLIDIAQPQGMLAAALLEPDAPLDSSFIAEELEGRRTGQSSRFYDITAWSLPLVHKVDAWWSNSAVSGGTVITTVPARDNTGVSTGASGTAVRARHGYAFAPGSDASIRLLAALLQDGVSIVYAQKAFRIGTARFPQGAFIARVDGNDSTVHARVVQHAAAAGADVVPLATAAVDEGTDLGSNSVVPVNAPRVALFGGAPVNGNSYGFTWYQFDQRIAYPTAGITADAITGGILSEFDVLVIPSAPAAGVDRALGDAGRDELQRWVRRGGVLITLENATQWLASERSGLSRFRPSAALRDSGAQGAPLPLNNPGAIGRAVADTLSPLLAGIRDMEWPVPINGDRVFAAPRDVRPGEVVLRFAPAAQLRMAGYLWPESPNRLAGTPYLFTERVGSGRVIGFSGDPNYRDLWRGLLPLFANAVFLGSSF
jgi:hypothetical protein